MLANLKQHGTVFNMADDQNSSDDLLNADMVPFQRNEMNNEPSSDDTFEEEK